jgi:hypothetical protein
LVGLILGLAGVASAQEDPTPSGPCPQSNLCRIPIPQVTVPIPGVPQIPIGGGGFGPTGVCFDNVGAKVRVDIGASKTPGTTAGQIQTDERVVVITLGPPGIDSYITKEGENISPQFLNPQFGSITPTFYSCPA